MPFLPFVFLGFCVFCVIYCGFKNFFVAVTGSFLILSTFSVYIAEILSIWGRYEFWSVVIISIFMNVVFFALFNKKICCGIRKLVANTPEYFNNLSLADVVFCIGLSGIVFLAVLKNAIYPPQNYDSLNFHCVRALLYWKNHSIHNMSYSFTPALYYYPPLNAILMSFGMVLTHGSDRLMNFVQLPSWIFAIYSVGEISNILMENDSKGNLAAKRICKYFSMILMACVPMALFQISTTQNDLLAASYGVIAICFLVKMPYLEEETEKVLYSAFAGMAGGLAFLSKITCGPILLTAGILFIILTFKKWKRKELIGGILIIAVVSSSINVGNWIRNAIDLNGDFIGLSAIQNTFGNRKKEPFFLKVILNIGYCFGSNKEERANITNHIVKFIANIFYEGNSRIESFDSWMAWYSHDAFPYAWHMIIIALCVVFLFVYCAKKKSWKIFLYMLACIIAYIINSGSMFAFVCSTRYLLPSLFMTLPLISVVAYCFMEKAINCGISLKLHKFFCLLFMVIIFCVSANVQRKDYYMPLPQYPEDLSYEEMHFRRGGESIPSEVAVAIYDLIKSNEYSNIGIQENVLNGIYPMIYLLKDERYHIEYINLQYFNKHQKNDFIPECILYFETLDEPCPEFLLYGETEYRLIIDPYKLSLSNMGFYTKAADEYPKL